MRFILALTVVLVAALGIHAEPQKAEKPKTARVVVTAELGCMHCDYGKGESCAVVLKLDEKTPLLLEGDVAKTLFPRRLRGDVVVIEGALKLKDKQMVLAAEKSRPYDEKEKNKVPVKGQAFVVGEAICGKCDLSLCETCTLAVKNAPNPIILDGELAADHAEGKGVLSVIGKLGVDSRGLLRIQAKKVDAKK